MRWGRCTNFVYDSHVVMEMDFLKQAEETDEIPTKQAIAIQLACISMNASEFNRHSIAIEENALACDWTFARWASGHQPGARI